MSKFATIAGNTAGVDALDQALKELMASRMLQRREASAEDQRRIDNAARERGFSLQDKQLASNEDLKRLQIEALNAERVKGEENRQRDDARVQIEQMRPDSMHNPAAVAKLRAYAAPGTFEDVPGETYQPQGPSRDTESGVVAPITRPAQVKFIGTHAQFEKRKADERAESAAAEQRKKDEETNRHNQAMERLGGQRIEVSSTNRNTMTPQQEIAAVRGLRSDYNQITKPAREMKRQLSIMEQGLTAAKRGDLAAGSQAVLVTFQKILDPTSVVRESEYARSAAGQSLMSRIQGAYEKLAQGGAGVPVTELERFAALARDMAKGADDHAKTQRKTFERTALKYGLDADLIFGDEDPGPANSPATGTPGQPSGAPPQKRFTIVSQQG